MIYTGLSAIDYLASKVHKIDAGCSSHWAKYHRDFYFTGDGFKGLEGFGGCQPIPVGLRSLAHQLLQFRFRRMGKSFPSFNYVDREAKNITTSQNRHYDLDVLRQTLTLSFLKTTIPETITSSSMACVIGDGFSSMSSLLLQTKSAGCVVLVNLTKSLLVYLWYLKLWLGTEDFDARVKLVSDSTSLEKIKNEWYSQPEKGLVIAFEAQDEYLLKACPIDYAINIVSMQEMDHPVTAKYFEDLIFIGRSRKLLFYCCNREEKTLPDDTVTRLEDYPWRAEDQILIDEICPWHRFYYSKRPPFYHPYNPIRHRLVVISS
jgi:hypothetical protein